MIINAENRRKIQVATIVTVVAMISVSGGYFLGKHAVKSDVGKCFVIQQTINPNVAPAVAMQCVSSRIK